MAQPFIFISYSRQDELEKENLLTHLKGLQQAGHITVWSDDQIIPGTDWQASIAQAIARADIALLLITANYLASDFITNKEVPALLSRHAKEGLSIIPVIAKPCAWQKIEWLASLKVRPQSQQPVWREAGYYAEQELAVIAAEIVDLHIHNLPDIPLSKDIIPSCPYRGLFAFRPEHAHLFFGREIFIKKLVQATESRSLVVVLGASGTGKSSVVLAGLVPVLNVSGLWLFTTFRPGDDPFLGLASALMPLLYENDLDIIDKIDNTRKLATKLREGMLLSDILEQIRRSHPDYRLLLIADQFEEIYTSRLEATIRQQFLDVLLGVVERAQDTFLHLILTLRVDFMGQAMAYRPLSDALQEADLKLGPMTHAELTEAIEKPAALQNVHFEEGLVERILDDVREEEGSLPLLEFALTELWQHQSQRTLTHTAYERIGQAKGALSRHADKVYQRLPSTEQKLVQRIFVQLINPGAGTEDTRRLAYRTDIELDWPLVAKLANERLVVTNKSKDGGETVELVHEALIRHWPQLQLWLEQDRDFLTWRLGLRADLKRWEGTNHDEGALLRGAPLAIAREKLVGRSADLTPAEQNFIEKSITLQEKEAAEKEAQRQHELEQQRALTEEQRQRAEEQIQATINLRKRTRWIAGVGAVALLLAIATGWFGLNANQNATEIAQQKEAAETELKFLQTKDPAERVTHLARLFELQGLRPRKLFWELSESEQIDLFTIKDEQLPVVIKGLYVTLADVNQAGYTDAILAAMAEALMNLQKTTDEGQGLKTELNQWQQARTKMREGKYEEALTQYDKVITLNGDNPATHYERAIALIELSKYEMALAGLDQVVTLAQNPTIAITGSLKFDAEFATTQQMIRSVRRLIEVKPELGNLLKRTASAHPNLQQADLILAPTPTPITAPDGAKMVLIPAGPFEMGSDNGSSNERPSHEVTLDTFYIDQHEVTNAQYAQCVASSRCDPLPWIDSYSRKSYYGDPEYDHYPVLWVSWEQAKRYCEWREARLPTEAEWEKAARGKDGRRYPWGATPTTCNLANYHQCQEDTTPVGAYPNGASPFGVYDMAGNVWEWVADQYSTEYYATTSGAQNPQGPDEGENVVIRGGGLKSDDYGTRTTQRGTTSPETQDGYLGFRCATAAP